ncbi:hypothetical protein [Mycobacterium tuberculosis]|uniref:hypothetical protein n=1 Tax=Mycobacterium tuberculosis TaxID=1773 RepID=UPI00272C4313|nr:hypothetical protein [Mycobacterium tuberculosis]
MRPARIGIGRPTVGCGDGRHRYRRVGGSRIAVRWWPSGQCVRVADDRALRPARIGIGRPTVGCGDGRHRFNATELGTEDLITPQDMVVTLSHSGYIKSQPLTVDWQRVC